MAMAAAMEAERVAVAAAEEAMAEEMEAAMEVAMAAVEMAAVETVAEKAAEEMAAEAMAEVVTVAAVMAAATAEVEKAAVTAERRSPHPRSNGQRARPSTDHTCTWQNRRHVQQRDAQKRKCARIAPKPIQTPRRDRNRSDG